MLPGKTLNPILLLIVTALLLSACGGNPPPDLQPDPDGEQSRGSIAGTVTLDAATGTALRAAVSAPVAAPPGVSGLSGQPLSGDWQLDRDNLDFVPGELIVSFKQGFHSQSFTTLSVDGVQFSLLDSIPAVSAQLFGAPADRERTLELARQLNARADVLYAHPNYIFHALLLPDDESYARQWHYPAIRLPQAWDVTTGSASTVVAVVDSGILHVQGDPARSHPDFAGKILPGYDFVSTAASAFDGDGRDSDPLDEILVDGSNSFHGSHVAGTIAAATNNGLGVAGVDWNAQILPVRVLGSRGSGTLVDIIDGILWAAGLEVPDVPLNANPADVINLSLGGPSSCTPSLQDALNRAAQQSIIIAAAGNSNANVATFAPARCNSVITVGASDPNGRRASYSNYGSRIDVMAPGGEMQLGVENGILSVSANPQTGVFGYSWQQGTSMAAPHVAGVVSLLKALQPDLGWQDALAVLQATALPLSAVDCDNHGSGSGSALGSSDCGSGLINAFLAVQSVRDGVTPPPPGGDALQFTPARLDLGFATTVQHFTLSNISSNSVNWALGEYRLESSNPELAEGAIYVPEGAPDSGTLAPGESVATQIGVDRARATPDNAYRLSLIFELEGLGEQLLELSFSTLPAETPEPPAPPAPPDPADPPDPAGPAGPMSVTAFLQDSSGELQPSASLTRRGVITEFRFDLLPGAYIVTAWSDENANDVVDAGDYFGTIPDPVSVTAGQETRGVAVTLTEVLGRVGSLEQAVRLAGVFPPALGD